MKKSLIIMLIATLLVGALMVSCNSDISEATSGGDKLVEIKIAGNSKGINAVGSMEDAESYYWYYRAGKNDSSVYRTGQTVALTNGAFADQTGGWKPVRSDNTAGLKESVLGYFSTGDWLFAFAAYKTALTVTDGFATISNESPVYSQASLNVEVSSNTIGADERVHITVTPTAGGADADALVVFPIDGLKWQYCNSATDANYAATVSGLSGKTAYMNVYYIAAGSTEEIPLARASATISNDSTKPSATFTAFKGYDSTSAATDKFTLNQVTIPASYVGTEYTLVFKVALSTAEGELIGEESTQSVTAYTNGRITISTSGTVAVEDNETQYIVIVDKVSAIQTASENDGKTVTTSAQIAAPAVSTAEVSSTNASVSTKNSKVEITSTNVSTSEKSAEKTSSVIIPAEGLKDTVKTLTATSTEGEGDNAVTTKTVKVEETSYNIVDKKDTSNTDVPSTFTGFTVNEGDAVISKLSYTMVATTTTTTTTTEAQGTAEPTVVSETTTTDSYSVTNFASENSSEVTYYIIKDYLDTDLVNVTVGYNGSGAQPIFSTTGTPDLSQVTNDESTTGTGYDPETGLIVFKTSHFSDFYVVASNTFVAENTTTGKKYYSLERAIARVEDGQTIELLANTSVGAGFTLSNPLILTAENVTFNLKEFTLTVENNFSFVIAGDGDKVTNGSITSGVNDDKSTKINSYILVVNNCNDVVLDGLTMTGGVSVGGDGDTWGYAVGYNGSTSNNHVTGGAAPAVNVTIKNCDIKSGDYYAVCSQVGSNVTIESGKYKANTDNNCTGSKVLHGCFVGHDGPEGSILVTGGKFNGTISEDNEEYVVLKGGYYSVAPAAGLVSQGYEVVADTTYEGYGYKVKAEQPVVSVVKNNETTNYYASSYTTVAAEHSLSADLYALNAAMAAVSASENGGETIILGKDISLVGVPDSNESGLTNIGGSEQLIYTGPTATFDFNGHTLNGMIMSGSVLSYALNQTPSSHLILTDSGSNDTCSINSNARVDGAAYQNESLWAVQSYITVNGGSYIQQGAGNVLTCQIQDKVDDHYGLIINDGRFEVTANAGCVVVDVIGDIDINGGTFINSGSIAPAVFAIDRGDSDVSNKVTIDGGYFEGWLLFDLYEKGTGSEIIINSGIFNLHSFEMNNTSIKPMIAGDNSNSTGCYSITINGGTFNLDPSKSANYDEGYDTHYEVTINGTVTSQVIDNVTWYTVQPNN